MNSSPVQYTELSEIEHTLHRPDTFIGSVQQEKKKSQWVVDPDETSIKQRDVIYSEGLIRIFMEIISNVIDNKWRSDQMGLTCRVIKVKVDIESGKTTVTNDGNTIPIEIRGENGKYLPEIIFGRFRVSSNYDDSENRKTSGRNGLGSKVCNIFSKSFTFSTVDRHTKKSYKQVWTNNMKKCTKPTIRSSVSKEPYTTIEYIPDFQRFGQEKYTQDDISVIKKYTYDVSVLTGIPVSFNGVKAPIKKLIDYAKLHYMGECTHREYLLFESMDSRVVVSRGDVDSYIFSHQSFVNGIKTSQGGVGVNKWYECVFRPLVGAINKKLKSKLTIGDVSKYFHMFIVTEIDNPTFSNQSKEKLVSPDLDTPTVSDTDIKKMMKWQFMDEILKLIDVKNKMSSHKTDGKKRRFVKVANYDQANKAGSSKSHECTLILCEGNSAKTYAVDGISSKGLDGRKGRDYFGVFAMRGKILNVKNANNKQIDDNVILQDIKKILGLRVGTDYSIDKNMSELNYGRVIILCDADCDGHHIKGLLINFFTTLFKSLVKRNGFLISMETPISRVTIPKRGEFLFYNHKKYEEFMKKKENQDVGVKVKYYKGLGASTKSEIRETFGEVIVSYKFDKGSEPSLNLAFCKKQSDKRKKWLADYDTNGNSLTIETPTPIRLDQSITDFINYTFIHYSIDDCHRSIPCVWDGLKEGQRKIMYSIFKKNTGGVSGGTIKVAQLAGYVAEHSGYHHGENNLIDTLVKMAQDFVGKNNISYLYKDGQFGSRLQGGKDAANGRYIFTKLEGVVKKLFRQEDFPIYNYLEDDGVVIEPEYYVPVIPTILVNGCTAGIGSGWSCSIPNYNPKDIIKWCLRKCRNEVVEDFILKPWYKGFKGDIITNEDTSVTITTRGIFTKVPGGRSGKVIYIVDELPIGVWTDNYKEYLEKLVETKKIKSFNNYSTPETVRFEIIPKCDSSFKFDYDNLRLTSKISTSNMVTFKKKNKLHHYKDVYSILEDFSKERLKTYSIRKNYIINKLEIELEFKRNKHKFISKVCDGSIVIFREKEEKIIEKLDDLDFKKIKNGFDYLLNISVSSFTEKNVNSLQKSIESLQNDLSCVKSKTEIHMWESELMELELAL
jgi:DNA topoisomerase-2